MLEAFAGYLNQRALRTEPALVFRMTGDRRDYPVQITHLAEEGALHVRILLAIRDPEHPQADGILERLNEVNGRGFGVRLSWCHRAGEITASGEVPLTVLEALRGAGPWVALQGLLGAADAAWAALAEALDAPHPSPPERPCPPPSIA